MAHGKVCHPCACLYRLCRLSLAGGCLRAFLASCVSADMSAHMMAHMQPVQALQSVPSRLPRLPSDDVWWGSCRRWHVGPHDGTPIAYQSYAGVAPRFAVPAH